MSDYSPGSMFCLYYYIQSFNHHLYYRKLSLAEADNKSYVQFMLWHEIYAIQNFYL